MTYQGQVTAWSQVLPDPSSPTCRARDALVLGLCSNVMSCPDPRLWCEQRPLVPRCSAT
jgi:hypothetical protein